MSLLGKMDHFLDTVCYIWHDSRVPVLARIFVVLAPLYWINPFDLIPDLQPGGYYDDFVIFCLLVVMAFRLVPEAVFRDARKATFLGRNVAVFGMLYVTVTGIIPCQAQATKFSNASDYCGQQQISLDCSTSPQKHKPMTQVQAKNPIDHGKPIRVDAVSYNQFFANSHGLDASQSATTFAYNSAAMRYRLPIFLANRGGQYQLYASDDASAAMLAHRRQYSFEMPTRFAGGIFVSNLIKFLSTTGSTC